MIINTHENCIYNYKNFFELYKSKKNLIVMKNMFMQGVNFKTERRFKKTN